MKALAKMFFPVVILALVASLFPSSPSLAPVNLGKVDPALLGLAAADPAQLFPIIVRVNGASVSASAAAQRVSASRALPTGSLPFVSASSALADYQSIKSLANDPAVQAVYYDVPLRTLDYDAHHGIVREPEDDDDDDDDVRPVTQNVYAQAIDADDAWELGYTGKGVSVALLDSGIYPAPDITLPVNRVVARVDLVGDASGNPDPGGHGTHLAGIIAGNGGSAPAGLSSFYRGVAPDANLIDVRVVDKTGNTNISTVIRGVEWVVRNRNTYNIRVMNLSLGAATPKRYTYRTDPLAAAVELAWLSGIVVVTSAGNTGPGARTIATPGSDPLVITVGAVDDHSTIETKDDSSAPFSAHGPTADGVSKPDLVAPGRRIVSLLSPGSTLQQLLPERSVTAANGAPFFRLSGTSMSAAMVSGVVALLLQQRPDLKPDQVKYILTGTAKSLRGGGTQAVGSGEINVRAALRTTATKSANANKRLSAGTALALRTTLAGQPIKWRNARLDGRDWTKITWDNVLWDNVLWDNILWDNILWDNILWDNILWDNILWDNVLWDNVLWDNIVWDSTSDY